LSQKSWSLTDRHNLFDAISATQHGRAETKGQNVEISIRTG